MSNAIKELNEQEYDEFCIWLDKGIGKGWISKPTCVTHVGLPNTDEEEQEWEDGHDPCATGVRIWV